MLHFILCLQALSNYHAHSVGNLEARTLWHADRVDWWMLLAWKEGIEMIDLPIEKLVTNMLPRICIQNNFLKCFWDSRTSNVLFRTFLFQGTARAWIL